MESIEINKKLISRIISAVPLILLSTFYFLLSYSAQASSYRIYFSGPQAVTVGSEFSVKILIDSDQPLNAYEVSAGFPAGILDFSGFNNGNSIIDVWQNQPLVYSGGGIKFSGGSLTPFSGKSGELLTLNLKALKEGNARLDFDNAAFYLANGKGTKIVPQTEGAEISVVYPSIAVATSSLAVPIVVDDTPPQIKYLAIVPDPINQDQKLVSSLVTDSDSGVKNLSMRTRTNLFWSDWQDAQNPTAVPLSVWAVDFKAMDNSGNITEKIIYDWNVFWRLALIYLAVAAGIIIILMLMVKKGRKQNEKIENSN
ncbi:MAG: hypothetical protein KGJ89_01810 [Patescibacteria group bacterium]|nr:cohesin domain-containing protein [Patescibacteria group bacterium]MDE2015613.1 hypothetical protein [Patescibacteria group bacterium]MDE2226670.1 hypothetical protein [Patescibacteria group bacterium]